MSLLTLLPDSCCTFSSQTDSAAQRSQSAPTSSTCSKTPHTALPSASSPGEPERRPLRNNPRSENVNVNSRTDITGLGNNGADSHLVFLYEVEVLLVHLERVLKTPALLFCPGRRLGFWKEVQRREIRHQDVWGWGLSEINVSTKDTVDIKNGIFFAFPEPFINVSMLIIKLNNKTIMTSLYKSFD